MISGAGFMGRAERKMEGVQGHRPRVPLPLRQISAGSGCDVASGFIQPDNPSHLAIWIEVRTPSPSSNLHQAPIRGILPCPHGFRMGIASIHRKERSGNALASPETKILWESGDGASRPIFETFQASAKLWDTTRNRTLPSLEQLQISPYPSG